MYSFNNVQIMNKIRTLMNNVQNRSPDTGINAQDGQGTECEDGARILETESSRDASKNLHADIVS